MCVFHTIATWLRVFHHYSFGTLKIGTSACVTLLWQGIFIYGCLIKCILALSFTLRGSMLINLTLNGYVVFCQYTVLPNQGINIQ